MARRAATGAKRALAASKRQRLGRGEPKPATATPAFTGAAADSVLLPPDRALARWASSASSARDATAAAIGAECYPRAVLAGMKYT